MFRKNVVIQLTEDIDNLSLKGTKLVVIGSDPAKSQMIEIGSKEEGYIEEFTDTMMDYLQQGKIKIEGPHRVKIGEVYWNHKEKVYIVPQVKVTSRKTKEVIIVYRTVNRKIKSNDRLSNQSYFITMKEFVMNCEYAGEF